MRAWDLHDNCMTDTQPWKMPLRAQDLLEHLTNYQLFTNYYYTVTFMLQPSKMQGEARNCEKRHFGALHAQLCPLRMHNQLENLTNSSLLIATHSDFYASTLKNARGSQKSRKEAFWRALRAITRFARTPPQKRQRRYRRLSLMDLRSEFCFRITIRSTTSWPQRFRTEGTPCALPSPNPPQKGNLLASLGG